MSDCLWSVRFQLCALVKSFLYRPLQSSPLCSLWRSLAINCQGSCTTKDNANALVSPDRSLSRDVYSFGASSEGDPSKTEKSWTQKRNDVFVVDSVTSLWGDVKIFFNPVGCCEIIAWRSMCCPAQPLSWLIPVNVFLIVGHPVWSEVPFFLNERLVDIHVSLLCSQPNLITITNQRTEGIISVSVPHQI